MEVIKLSYKYKDIISKFCSGNILIDYYLTSGLALQNLDPITYILVDSNRVAGYYSISVNSLDTNNGANDIRVGGSVHLDKFAIDLQYQKLFIADHYYISDFLLNDLIQKCYSIRDKIGISFITLSSTNEGLNLYQRNNFYELEDDMSFSLGEKDSNCINMYYPLDEE